MALTINSNPMAAKAAKSLSRTYGLLSTSVERLSSGLRINSASDDPVGLGIREMMRSDIAVYQQGIRNTADAISMLQLADSSLGSIDTLLTRMRELAEQAATGTYTDTQREIINSEYQAMANEIDRIANAATFNGVRLLDGSLSGINGGQGMMIHFGANSNPGQDYYNVSLGDIRATSSTGLRVGGDAKNDIWAQGGAAMSYGSSEGCCAGGFNSLTGDAGFVSGAAFSFGYNWDWQANNDNDLKGGQYTAGVWRVNDGESLQSLIERVNQGTQARVGVKFDGTVKSADVLGAGRVLMSAYGVCFDDEAYYWGNQAEFTGAVDAGKTLQAVAGDGSNMAKELTSAINNNSASKFWAMLDTADAANNVVYVFAKDGGSQANGLLAGELAANTGANAAAVQIAQNNHNDEQPAHHDFGDFFHTVAQADDADPEAHESDQGHPEQLPGRAFQGGPEKGPHLAGVQAVQLAADRIIEIGQHPAGNSGVEHHQHVIAQDAQIAVNVPLGAFGLKLAEGAG
ncbi:flagellin, partial [Deltaproteobacteria bacterium OttesenSCG-928-M10]|nr:flagellin [Deltaproteobacteria bacterium OttesenSCG-928-M10]